MLQAGRFRLGVLTVPSVVKLHRCTVVKLPLSKRSSMLLVLPHQGSNLHDIESELPKNIISDWVQNLSEG